MKINANEQVVGEYYDAIWSEFARWWCAEETLGLHYALYEKGITSFKEAVYNMNDFIGKLLQLSKKKNLRILDAGCGVGGTSIYLAKKYPALEFVGITVTPGQLQLAQTFAQERKCHNVQFFLRSYVDTGFPDNSFDGIYALESACYATNMDAFIDEMQRILKPGGVLVVVDGFRTDRPLNPIIQLLYDDVNKGRGNLRPPSVTRFKQRLDKRGFKDIKVDDITKNVSRSQLRSFLIGIPFFLFTMTKRVVKYKTYDWTRDRYYYLGASVLAALVGLSGITAYYAVKSVNKEK